MTKKDLRYQKTNELLQITLIDLLQTQTFEKITVNDLCQQSLIGRSTFYHHYDDKYELLNQMITDLSQKFQELINRRNTQLNDDSLLIYLYKELFDQRQTFLTLLDLKSTTNDLATQIQQILKNASLDLIEKLPSNLPIDFLTDIYAINALTAITWTLKNGYSKEVAAFMNDSLKKLIL
ncbi:TetR/AcrR family transcriptional regulator [Companilactobacillus huachuanensis]|uniref:TetR/AcrR family transcriptional regulator n=1 Tax=Companilactobacillus huachuanensis TaxID=2559914 RepID=A0ABW1RHT0_9LACO|nr:TetR/AcrR family transcriptional regulator [Companilactobacillus huachuanensis]